MLDETEAETIPNARTVSVEEAHGSQPAELPDRETMVRWFGWLQGVADERQHEKADVILKFVPAKMDDAKLAANYSALRRYFPDITDDILRAWDAEDDSTSDDDSEAF